MNGHAEARTQRRRRDDDLAIIDRARADPPDPAPSLVIRTTTQGSYPTNASRVFAVQAVIPSGNEAEGVTPTMTVLTPIFHATNLGTAIPAQGTDHVATVVNGRVVFSFFGS